jgi:hypothetical protein
MKRILLIYDESETAEALERYIRFVMGVNNVERYPLSDPYRQKEVFEKACGSDLLVADGFLGKIPKGFQFAKALGKKALVLFFPGEIEIETEGSFWLVLPSGLDRLGDKIKELLEKPMTDEDEYENQENHFPELRERKDHNR